MAAGLLILFAFDFPGSDMGKLTTHVLDTARGLPGNGITVTLILLAGDRETVSTVVTNQDGRTDSPLMNEQTFRPGTYELIFAVGDYFRRAGGIPHETSFLEDVVIRVNLANDEHYHVPLLVSPWSYSTYRGS